MKVVILSAGRGSRLLPLTEDRPKCLLPVGEGTVLEHQLRAFVDLGATDIAVITGFRSDLVDEVIEGWRSDKVKISGLYNPFFQVSDNLASCWMARSHMDGDFVLVNGDTVFEHDVLRRVLASPVAPVTVTIDRKESYDADDMKVELDHGLVTAVGKGLPYERVNGESIGLLYFRGEGPGLFVDALEQTMRTPQGLQWWFLRVIDRLAKTGVVAACTIEGLDWAELDTKADLEMIRSMFG